MPDKLDHIIDEAAGLMHNRQVEISSPELLRDAVFEQLDRKKKKRRFFFFFFLLPFLFCGMVCAFYVTSGRYKISGKPAAIIATGNTLYQGSGKHEKRSRKFTTSQAGIATGNNTQMSPEGHGRLKNTGRNGNHTGISATQKNAAGNISAGKNRKKQETSMMQNQNNGLNDQPVIPGNAAEIETSAATDTVAIKKSGWRLLERKLIPQLYSEQLPSKSRKSSATQLSLGAFSSVLLNMYDIKGDTLLSGLNGPSPAFDVGLSFELEKRRFVFQADLGYSRLVYHQVPVDTGNKDMFTQYLHQAEITAWGGYRFSAGRFSVTPMAGLSAGVFQRDQYYLIYDSIIEPVKAVPVPTVNVYVKADFRYVITDKWSVGLSPIFRYNLAGFNEMFLEQKIRPFSVGLRAGVHYHF